MAAQPLRNRSRWSLDFTKSSRAGGSDMPSPPGFSASINALHAEASRQSDPSLRAKRSWDLALGPIKQVSENIPKKNHEIDLGAPIESGSNKPPPDEFYSILL